MIYGWGCPPVGSWVLFLYWLFFCLDNFISIYIHTQTTCSGFIAYIRISLAEPFAHSLTFLFFQMISEMMYMMSNTGMFRECFAPSGSIGAICMLWSSLYVRCVCLVVGSETLFCMYIDISICEQLGCKVLKYPFV